MNKTATSSSKFSLSVLWKTLFLIGLFGIGFYSGVIYKSDYQAFLTDSYINKWERRLSEQDAIIKSAHAEAQGKLDALVLKFAKLQARLIRVDAMGEHILGANGMEDGDFSFGKEPALENSRIDPPDFFTEVDQLMAEIELRENELSILKALTDTSKIRDVTLVARRPVEVGWLTSRYGMRTDPFSGQRRMHGGIDFAGKANSEILAAAAGVVTDRGAKAGYGRFVELTHPGGYKTTYSHNSENLVDIGEIVQKGQPIALMGSSGKSTGPHVHFEVHKNGTRVNPAPYIERETDGE